MPDPVIKIQFDYSQVKVGTREVLGDLESIDKGADGTQKKFKSLEGAFDRLGIKATTLASRSRGAATGIRILSNSVFDLLGNLKLQSSTIASTNKDIVNMKKALNKTGATVVDSAEDFNKLATSIDNAGNKAVTLAKRSRSAGKGMHTLNNALKEMIDNLQDQIEKLNASTKNMNKNIKSFNNFEKTIKKGTRAIKENSKAHKKLNTNMRNTGKQGSDLRNIFAGLITLESIRLIIEYTDAWAKLTNNIRIFAKTEEELISIRTRLFDIAQKTRTELTAQTTLYNRLKIAQTDLGISETGILKITEAVGYALGVTSTSALEARGALIQLGQAFGSGIVRAEEFNAINEGTPKIMQAVAKGLGMTRSQLRSLVLEGKVTSTAFAASLLSMGGSLKNEYANVNMTIGMSFTNLKSSMQKFSGELATASNAYQDFVELLERTNNILLNNSYSLIENSNAFYEISKVLFSSVGAIAGIKLLQSAIVALNSAFAANKIIAMALAISTATTTIAYGYDRIFGIGAKNAADAKHSLEQLIDIREKAATDTDKYRDTITVSNIEAGGIVDFAKEQIKSIDKSITSIQSKMSRLKVLPGYTGPSKIVSDELAALQSAKERYTNAIKTENRLKQEGIGLDRISEGISLSMLEMERENLNLVKKTAEETAYDAQKWKELSPVVKGIKKQIEDINKEESMMKELQNQKIALTKTQQTMLSGILDRRKTLGDLIKKHNDLVRDAGKDEKVINSELKDRLLLNKQLNDQEKYKISVLKKTLKKQVAIATQAQQQIDMLKRRKDADSDAVKSLIAKFKVFIDEGAKAERSAKSMNISITEAYGPYQSLVAEAKKLTTEMERQGVAQSKINNFKTKITTQGALKQQIDTFFSTSGMTIDKEGLALYDRISVSIKENKDQMQSLKDEHGKAVDISMLDNLTQKERLKLYLEKKKYELSLTDFLGEQGKSRYQIEIDSINKTAAAYKKLYPELTDVIAKNAKAQIAALHPINEYITSMEDPIIAIENVFVSAFKSMEDSLVNFVKTGKFEWKDFVSSIIEGMLKIEAQRMTASLAGSSKGIIGGIASLFSSGTSGVATSAVSTGLSLVGLRGRASGGPVASNTPYIVGEVGPELFVPNTAGNIVPNHDLGDGGGTTNVILNVENNTGQDVSANQVSSERIGKDLVLSIVLEGANNNGAFKRNLSGALNR